MKDLKNTKGLKALFLDRDGVINVDHGYVSQIRDFEFCQGVFEALRGFARLGYTVFVVTNQSGIGRGYYSLEQFLSLNEFMLQRLKDEGIDIKKVYFCPHAPEQNCECRKPKAGMILQAINEFDIDPKSSIMVGDKDSDIAAANSANIAKSYKLKEGLESLLDVYMQMIKEKI